ncbi:MAG TPA: cation diffusion facilitator family transporter [Caulobacteraceae bacterium]|jgi:cation diffusion facilitator family transporter|nr:cation diffusion facilitator family transporter [Caulobacteraceae bacterium]
MVEGSKLAVYASLAGNLAIAVAKVVAFFFSGSVAMLTEAVHSLVDTLNQGLLLFGMRRAARPPSERHPFGYGLELYFWTLVVALMIFVTGAVASIYQGVRQLLAPSPVGDPMVNYVVLGVAVVFEGASFLVAWREQRKAFPRTRLLRFVRWSKDPGLFVSLIENSAALVGIAIAAIGVFGSTSLHLVWADGLASIAIGLLLVAVAIFLLIETRSLMIGEAAAPPVVARVRAAIEADPRVTRLIEVLSLHLGPEEILMGVTIDFDDGLPGPAVEIAAQEISETVSAIEPRVTRLFLRPGRRPDAPFHGHGYAPLTTDAPRLH